MMSFLVVVCRKRLGLGVALDADPCQISYRFIQHLGALSYL